MLITNRAQSRKVFLIILALFGLTILPGFMKPANALFGLGPCTQTGDFDVSSDPFFLPISPGGTGSSTITVESINGFSGTVSLTDTTLPPMIPGVTLSLSASSLTPTPGGSKTSTLTIGLPTMGLPPFGFTVVINGTSGITSHAAEILVFVATPSYAISASPDSLAFSPGSSVTSTISVTSLYGFVGTVTLMTIGPYVLSPPTVSLSKTSITLPGPSTSTLTVSASLSTTPGLYSVGIFGNGTGTPAFVSIEITAPKFDVSANPYTLTVLAGGTGSSTVNVQSLHGFSGAVSLTDSSSSSDVTPKLSSSSVTINPSTNGTSALDVSVASTTAPGAYFVTVTGSNGTGALDDSTTITVDVPGPDFNVTSTPETLTLTPGGPSETSTVTLTSLRGFSGKVDLKLTCSPGVFATISTNSVDLTSSGPGATQTGTVTISVNTYTHSPPSSFFVEVAGNSSSQVHSSFVVILLSGPTTGDFSISATGPVSFVSGSTGSSTVTLTSVGGSPGTVALSTVIAPSTGLSVACATPSPSPLPASGSSTSTCTLSSSTSGTYSVVITGTSSSHTHSTTITVTVTSGPLPPDFEVSGAPSSVTFTSGASKTSTLTITSVNGFNSAVTLSTSTSPSAGLTVSCGAVTPSPVPSGGTSTSTCTFSSSTVGSYTVSITGTSGLTSHTATVNVGVTSPYYPPDFGLVALPASLTIQAGSSGTSTITASSTYGFTGDIALTSTIASSGLSATFSPATITLGASGTSTLTITVPSGVSSGTYAVTISGSGGGKSHTATITVTVTTVSGTPLQPSNTIFGLDPATFYTLIGVIAAGAIAGVLVVWRRMSTRSTAATA